MKKLVGYAYWFYTLLFLIKCVQGFTQITDQRKTFCNPVDLPYMFQPDGRYRSAADPVMVFYKNKYWLFVSKNDGYYVSNDLVRWEHIKGVGYPTEIFAPTVTVIHNRMYLTTATGKGGGTFVSDTPMTGKWKKVSDLDGDDPATFLDQDGRLYLYYGCSDKRPISVRQVDTLRFNLGSPAVNLFGGNAVMHGWEVPGDSNELKAKAPWIEGSWMNRIGDKYYLQYAAPGTQYETYADGLYISENPVGPFTYAPYSPFSFKPTGFVTGTGHSSTFKDRNNNYWHVTTLSISVRHMFERRVGLFPTGVLADGQLVTNTYLGDYPQYAIMNGKEGWKNNLAGWMLLSYDKPAKASSTLPPVAKQDFNTRNAFDENVRTWWSATSGRKGEWLQVDLQQQCEIDAIQVNFADQDADMQNAFISEGYGYTVLASGDGVTWHMIVDRRTDRRDAPHDYVQLEHPEKARYIKIINEYSPAGEKFSLYDLRIFGKAPGSSPAQVKTISARLNHNDQREAFISWTPARHADFYIVRYGIAGDKLWSNYQVYNKTSLTIGSLNVGVPYYVSVDAVNGHGITPGRIIVKVD